MRAAGGVPYVGMAFAIPRCMEAIDAFSERFRGRFDAWDEQIDLLIRELPERQRRSEPIRRLIKQRGRVRHWIEHAPTGARQYRQLDREWRDLRRTWLTTFREIELREAEPVGS